MPCVEPDSYAAIWLLAQMDQTGLVLLNWQCLQIKKAWNVKKKSVNTILAYFFFNKTTPEIVVNSGCTNNIYNTICIGTLQEETIHRVWYSKKAEGYSEKMEMQRSQVSGCSWQQSNKKVTKQNNKPQTNKQKRH